VVAGDDQAAAAAGPLGLLDPPLGLTWWPRGSGAALALASWGLVHAAGICLGSESGENRGGPSADLLRLGAEVITLCS
jgi:hypothetical protein